MLSRLNLAITIRGRGGGKGLIKILTEQSFVCQTPEELGALGARLGTILEGGAVLLLQGGLGAGKTTLAKGVAESLGLAPEDVTSPTFTLVNYYRAAPISLYHIDLYRLSDGPATAYAIGLDEILADMQAVTLIEWPERLAGYAWPAPCYQVVIEGDGDAPRRVFVKKLPIS